MGENYSVIDSVRDWKLNKRASNPFNKYSGYLKYFICFCDYLAIKRKNMLYDIKLKIIILNEYDKCIRPCLFFAYGIQRCEDDWKCEIRKGIEKFQRLGIWRK